MSQLSVRRCPYCFAALPEGHDYVACPVKILPDGSSCAEATTGPAKDRVAFCAEHDVALVPHCWVVSCNHPLPVAWNEVTTTCLAMAGTRASGKTVFVGMAANLLLRWGHLNGLTVNHYSPASRASFEERFGALDPAAPLYDSTMPEQPGSDAVQREPVLLRIQESGRPRDHVLVLRDVAGEDLQNAGMDRDHFRFLAHADGLILMVDSGTSRAVRNVLGDEIAGQGSDFQPAAVWGNLESLSRAVVGETAKRPPVAVTISKFDYVLRAAAKRESPLHSALAGKGLRLHHDPSLQRKHWYAFDADLLDQELRTLCSRYLDQSQLVDRARAYENPQVPVRFFALSSLGIPPVIGRVAKHGTPSYRCLDPIKWFLMQAGLVASG